MNAFITELRSRFDELESRERWAVILLGAFLAVTGFYLLIWSPAYDYAESSRLNHNRHYELLSYLQSTEDEARASASNPDRRQVSGQSLLTTVSRTAQGIGIKPSRMQPEGGEAVSVWYDAVAFTKLMLWLERLEAEQGVVVRQVSIERRDEPGQVSARLILRG